MTEGITEDSLETPLTHAPNSLPKESKAFHMVGTLNHPRKAFFPHKGNLKTLFLKIQNSSLKRKMV